MHTLECWFAPASLIITRLRVFETPPLALFTRPPLSLTNVDLSHATLSIRIDCNDRSQMLPCCCCAVYAWEKAVGKRCASAGSTQYHSLSAAKKACSKVYPPCGGVYDQQCDGKGVWRLCSRSHLVYSAQHSCVYKSRPGKRCPCQNGTPAIRPRSVRVL